MRAIFLLGSLNSMAAGQLRSLNGNVIYYFSTHEVSLPGSRISCYRLPNPQSDALKESAIVECCIERNILSVASLGDDAALMRRALRLSELRIEARSYLNAIDFLQKSLLTEKKTIRSVIFVSHYLCCEDATSALQMNMNISWRPVLHSRFFSLFPGLNYIVTFIHVLETQLFRWNREHLK
ncbi:hypothetical protein [Pseudomonas lopnurensis]|uniref:hypothetical protein n=1 Tax=Pseudomonas lopnurensis TaxID=1477517 RepID=UPI0028A5E073|nr:hypothetical protein [Pseudomonas lopnurensis]